jgi:hypothetical protein
MDSSTFITVITALATLIGASSPIIVALIQANKEKQKSDNGILLPSNVVLHRPKTQVHWFVVLSFAALGGFAGYSGASLASTNSPTEVPTITATVAIASKTSEPTFTNSVPTETLTETPTLEIVPTSTNTPEPLPTSDTHLGIENGCIDYRFWSSKDDTGIAVDKNGCLQLLDWGFFAQDKKLYLLPLKNYDGRSHGLNTSLSGDVEINFKFQVDKIQTGVRQAYVRFGIVSKNYSDGKFLAYHYLPDYPNYLYPKLFENDKYGDPFSVNLEIGKPQQVTMSIHGNFLTVTLDGQVVLNNLLLRFDNRIFSLDYFLPPSSDLSAYISEFSIESK